MAEPQIQYVKTSDGVNIAYYTIGQGPALLYLVLPRSHLEVEWQIDPMRMAITAAAQRSTFVRLDPRGCGLSDRDPDDFALDSLVLDIEAVVDRLGLDELRIHSEEMATVPALAYTARHPDKVTHLVQWPAASSWADLKPSERIRALAELAKVDLKLASETLLRTTSPGVTDQQVRELAGLLLDSINQSSFERLMKDARQWDADAEATSMSTPTLLLHLRTDPNVSMATTRRVAGLIKDSRVAFMDSGWEAAPIAARFFKGDLPDLTEPASVQTATPPEAATFRTIFFTDVEGSTALTDRLGDANARDLLREHERITREALKTHGGSEVKTMGDGFMASFSSATKALECAIAIQSASAERNESAEEPIKVRIGLNAGEPIEEDEDLFGTAVNLAARIAAKADGGEILVSDVVRQLVAGKKFLFNDRGETELRGFSDSVRLFEVRWSE